jgi:hypothetical protein
VSIIDRPKNIKARGQLENDTQSNFARAMTDGASGHATHDTQTRSAAAPRTKKGRARNVLTPTKGVPSPSEPHDASGLGCLDTHRSDAAASDLPEPGAIAVLPAIATLHPALNEREGGGQSAHDTQSVCASPSQPDHTDADAGQAARDPQSLGARPASVVDESGKEGGGHIVDGNQSIIAPTSLSALLELAARRRNAIRERMAMQRKQEAYARVLLGYRPGADTDVKDRAGAMLAAIRAGKATKESPTVAALLADYLCLHDPAIAACEAMQAKHEKDIARLVKSLPAWPWVKACKGFGANNLASLLAETGDLSNYANPAKLWKRMGVGLVGDRRQGNPADKADKAAWIEHGYKAERRSVLWNIGACLMKAGGVYADLYRERKKVELVKLGLPDDGKSMHAHRRAQRWMEKRALRDLWRAWRNEHTAG